MFLNEKDMELNRQNWHGMGETPECGRVLMLICKEDGIYVFQLFELDNGKDWEAIAEERAVVYWAYLKDIAPFKAGDRVMMVGKGGGAR